MKKLSTKFAFTALLASIAAFNADAQVDGDYRTRLSGNFNANSWTVNNNNGNTIWEVYHVNQGGGNSWNSTTVAPPANTPTITIQSGSALNLIAPVSVNSHIIIEDGATLNITGAGSLTNAGNLTFNNATLGADAAILGTGMVSLTGAGAIISGNGNVVNLTIDGNKTIATASTISISGDLTLNNNPSVLGNGAIRMSGTTAAAINNSGTINNLIIDKGTSSATMSGGGDLLSIKGLLSMSSGTLNTNDELVLVSDAAGTARVGQMLGTINGKAYFQRYFPTPSGVGNSGRAWRLVSFPVKGATNTIADHLQNTTYNSIFGIPTGVEIWGSNGTGLGVAGNGIIQFGSSSMRGYNEGNNTWAPITSTRSQELFTTSGNKPYLLFVSGPFGSGNLMTGATATTAIAHGELISGSVQTSFNTSATNKIMMITNPYPCAIDFDAFYNDNPGTILAKFWTVDPYINDIGAYNAVQKVLVDWVDAFSAVTNKRYIQPGQSIFVEAINYNSTVNLTFHETHKVTGSGENSVPVFRLNNGGMESMHVKLNKHYDNNQIAQIDGAFVACHNDFSKALVPGEDGNKFFNFSESLYIPSNNASLAIEGRPLFENGDTLRLGMYAMKAADYQLEFVSNIEAPGMVATLYDTYTNTQQVMNLGQVNMIDFTVDANPASKSASRFFVVFSGAWATSVNSTANNAAKVSAYPNPVTGNEVTVELNNVDAGAYKLQVMSVAGQLMSETAVNLNGTAAKQTVNVNQLAAGTYFVRVVDQKENLVNVCKIVKQ